MSWDLVYSYFTEKLEGIGCAEWVVPFDEENIPSSLIDRAFVQSVISITSDQLTNQSLETTIRHEVRIFYKGFRDPRNAEKEALAKAEEAVKACVSHVAQGADFKGVYFTDLSLEPLNDATNDNVVVAILRFDVRMFLCIE